MLSGTSGAAGLLVAAGAFLWVPRPERASAVLDAFDAFGVHLPGQVAVRDGLGAVVEAHRGRRDEARSRVADAHRRLAEMTLPDDAAKLAIAAGQAFGSSDTTIEPLLREARAFYEQVAATVMLELIDALPEAASRPGADEARRVADVGTTAEA
jgi:hypothetical protein